MYICISLFALFLAMQTPSLYNNFTYLSYTSWRPIYIIWVLLLASFLLYKVLLLYRLYTYLTKSLYLLIYTSFFAMIIGAMMPYTPGKEDLLSSMHVLFSSGASLLLLGILQILIYRLQLVEHQKGCRINMYFHWFILSFVTIIIMFGSINIIVELYFTFIVLFHLYLIENT